MNASGLSAKGQRFHAAQLPATITIAGQGYACGTSGRHRDRDLVNGGWLPGYKISFWLAVSAFAEAELPVLGTFVVFGEENYVVRQIPADPTGQTLTLMCRTPDSE